MIERLIIAILMGIVTAIVATPVTLYLKERHPLLIDKLKWRFVLICLISLIIIYVLVIIGILGFNLF